jgi:hypothetical protein
MDVQRVEVSGVKGCDNAPLSGSVAGTQALPVDTPKRPVGRPKTITDMKAYKAERARKYRADKKAAKAASTHSQAQLNTTREKRDERTNK